MHQDLRTRERNFKNFLSCLSSKITTAIKIKVSAIHYTQYLYPTDPSRITKIAKKTPPRKGKSRIKCVLIVNCSYEKLDNWDWALATINNILSRQWELVRLEGISDKCGILISVNPHNVK